MAFPFAKSEQPDNRDECEYILNNGYHVSNLVWDICESEKSDLIKKFNRKFGTIRFSINSLIASNFKYCDESKSILNELEEFVKYLNSLEVCEIFIPENFLRGNTSAESLKEVVSTWGNAVFVSSKNTVVTYGNTYDDAIRAKYLLQIRLGMVKPTRRRQRINAYTQAEKNMQGEPSFLKRYSTSEGIQIYVYKAGNTKLPVDCVVNAANETLQHVDGWFSQYGGIYVDIEMNRFIKTNGQLETGMNFSTTAGNLPYKKIIHALCPKWSTYKPYVSNDVQSYKEDLYKTYYNSLKTTEELGFTSVAIPTFSKDMLDVPADIIAEQCVKAALNYSRLTEGKKRGLTEIHFVGMETDKLLYIQQELQLLLVTKDFAVTAGINKSESGRTANLGADSLFAEPSKIQNSSFHELQDDGKRQTFTFGNKVIRICKGDIFTEKASAIVVTTDEMGNGGSLKSSVDNQIAVECRDVYNRKFAQMIGRNPRLGNIFILDGYSCGYDCIISIVFPSRAQKGPLSQRRRSLRHIFSTLFQMIEQDERIQSVVTCLFGINDKTEEDLQLWSNAFMDSFIKGSSPLDITIVCKNIAAYKVICEFCNQTTKSFNTERNEMGNFSNLSDVNQMQMRKAFLDELDDDPVTRRLYDKVIREGLETDTTVRVMLIGCFGQGKTTLARRLQGQHLQNITSTDGIEVHRCISKEDEISCTWTLKDNENDRDVSKRLATVALKEIQGNSKEDANKNNLNQTRPCFQSTDEIKSTVNNETLLDYADNNVQSHKKETTEEPLTRQGHQNLIVTRINPTMEKKKTYFHSSNTPTLKQHKCKLTGEFRKALEELKEKELQPGILKTKKINVWDFGGQYIYYATHQLFHSKYAVYLLVFNLTVALNEEVKDQDYPGKSKCKTMKDYINFWMHSIHSFVGSSDGKEPVVILVGTHRDKLKSEEEAETYFEAVRELFASSTLRFHIYFKHFALSLFDEDEKEINDLRRSILQVGERRENQIAIPVKWILLEDKLKGHEQRNIISFADLQIVDKEGESPIGDETELKMFLKFQHAKGIYFYFDEGLLSSHVVLNPQYVIDAFKSIIKSKRFCLTKAPELVPFWMKLSCEATLVAELLHGIWKNSSEDFIKHEDVLLLMLKKHRIIAEVLIFGNKTDVLSLQPQGYFIVPSLLKRADEGQIKDFLTGKRKSTVSFVFCFDYSGTVETIFHRLMATAIGTWPILSYGDIQMVFDNGGIFEIDSYHAALMKLEKGNIQLLIVARCYNKDVLEGRGDYFRRFAEIVIKQEFRKLKQYSLQLETNLPYEMKLQCFHVEHKCAGSKNLTTLKAIQNFQGEVIPCPDNYSHNLLRNQIEMDWFKRSDTEDFPKREITNKEYSKLAQAIGESWETLGIRLGVNRVAIQHIKMKNLDPVMKIYEMLLKWKELNAGRATLKALVKQLRTLPEDTVNWDIVYNMKDNFF